MDREDPSEKSASRDSSKELVVKSVELPIKEVISLVDLEHIIDDKPNIAEGVIKAYSKCITYEDRMNVRFEHNEDEFYVFCACQSCLDYREVILKFIVDHLNSRITWNILRRNIKKFYQPIIDNAPPKIAEIYESLVEDVKYSWLLNGTENKTKQNHLEFLWDVWLTDFVTFILFTTLLMDDDPHQLFQLMSYQVECFARAYAEGLKEQISTGPQGQLPAETMITYVLKGYEEMCKVADNMSGFLFAFERAHLQQFSLNWTLLNKRMYQKWVYSAFASYMPECIIKLKDEVSAERYLTLVREYINFDDDMTSVNEKWKEVWISLNNYHILEKEQQRRSRIRTINNIFETIKREVSVPFVQFVNIPDWGTHSDRQVVWQNLVAYVNERWPSTDVNRLNATVFTDSCRDCKHIIEFHTAGCSCVTCLIAGAPNLSKTAQESENHLCSKCSFMEKIDKDGVNYISKILKKCTLDSKTSEAKEKEHVAIGNMELIEKDETKICEENNVYHLSWAVFRHLKDRKPYPHKTIEAKYFCSQCKRTACLLAKKFLNKEIAFALASPLMKNYQPLSMSLDKLVETVSCGVLYTQKAISVLYVPSQDMIRRMHDDIVINNLGILINSAVASYFADAEFDPSPPQLEHLEVVDNDIQLPIQYLEKNMKSKKFLDFFGKTLGVSLSDEKESTVSPNFLKEAILEEIKNIGPSVNWFKTEEEVSKEPCEETPTEPVEQVVEKQEPEAPIESPKSKKLVGCKCCTDHLSSKEQNLKETNFNKMCYPDKECNHTRINETRDRLRKKLNQLSTTKKNTKTINKNTSKSSLELIKTLNKNPTSLSILSKEVAKLQVKTPVGKGTTTKTATTKPVQEKEDKTKAVVAKECKVAITPQSPNSNNSENLDEWVKDTLSFIEGSVESKKVKNSVNNKKAAKKAKQKQKKEETKRIEELEQFRSQFHDLYIKEFTSKNELRKQKTAKKRDKKRIAELESNIKKLSKAKSKIEYSILELIATVKSANSTFKFSYLPTKEQQLDILQKINPQPQSIKPVIPEEPKIYYPPVKASDKHPRIQLAPESPLSSSPDDGVDPSKRIVTIRRVNLPNVSEPQVTVTAKGPSPDKDRLLYTFINGQLVPARYMDTKTLSVLQTKLPLQAHVLPAVNEDKINTLGNTTKKTALNENVVEKTKTQLKKERKRAKKLETKKENETRQSGNRVSLSEKDIAIQTNRKVSDANNCDQFTKQNSKGTNLKMQPKNVMKSLISETDISNNNNSRGSKKLKRSKQVAQAKDPILDMIAERRGKIDIIVKEKEKNPAGKAKKVVDNGQFDNNQFKMLHLDEFSSEAEDSLLGDSPNSQVVQSKNVETSRNKSSKYVQQKNKNKTSQTKSDTKVKLSKQNSLNIYNYKDDKSTPQTVKSYQPISVDANDKKSKKKGKKSSTQNGLKQMANTSSNIDKTVQNVEKMAQSLQNSMQRLHLSADTTIELAKESETTASFNNLNVSIMEQLNRGVQVEDLTLPPGITLTKVDPRRAEALRAKTESIGKLSQPLHATSSTHLTAPSIVSPALLPQLGQFVSDQSGVIMVDGMRSKRSPEIPAPINGKRSRKSKRRSKKKNASENIVKDSNSNLSAKGSEPKMITLRNPMFHGPNANNPMISMANRVPMASLPMDQPAAIIKNENGMFTIRNPALHQAFSNGLSANYRQHTTNSYPANDVNSNLSYFSDNDPKIEAYSSGLGSGKLSAIGSEVKNAQQQKKIGYQWSSSMDISQPNVSGITPSNHSSMQQKYQQSSYYNDFEVFPSNASNHRHLFHNDDHNCDDSPPPSVMGFNRYLDGIPNNGTSKYDDMSFLRNLIPGQRLNSEVTIHNINESKFSGNNSSPHRIDITPITRISSKSNDYINDHHQSILSKGYPAGLGEYGENLFAPNQMLNLNELESDERDIESFKRFSYGFEPPKEKPKVNINVNDLLVNNRKSPNTRTSEESLDSFVRNVSSLKISSDGIVNGADNLPETNKGNLWW